MSEKLEVGLIILAAVAVALAVIRLAWGIVEEIVDEVRDERERRAVMAGSRWTAQMEDESAGPPIPYVDKVPTHEVSIPVRGGRLRMLLAPRVDWDWPAGGEYLVPIRSVEPVRQSFRSMLEGGPDYRG